MPSRRSGGGGTTKRKHSLGNLRRAHPASGATWNVQVVRGKMSSKCLWHACRALILGLTLMLLGAGMATLGYYADHLSMGSELRGNVTVRVKNDLKGFHLNNFAYVGPIVMGFGGFIVVASCVMTFEARDSAAKVVPARLRAGGGGSSKNASRSNQGSSASQRRGMGAQYQSSRWDQHFGVFRSSPGDAHQQPQTNCISGAHAHSQQPFDREALTAELVKFSKSLSASTRFCPQWRRLSGAGSAPDLSGGSATAAHAHANTTTTNSNTATNLQSTTSALETVTNYYNLLSLNNRLSALDWELYCSHRRHRRHHHRHSHHNHHTHKSSSSSVRRVRQTRPGSGTMGSHPLGGGAAGGGAGSSTSGRNFSNSSSLIQRATRECSLLQPPAAGRVYWQASSFDGGSANPPGIGLVPGADKRSERTKRSDTAKRHVLARQRPIEQEEARDHGHSPLGHRRNSTMSDSSYSGRWTARCASIASRTSSIESRRVQVDLHSPEVMPKSILRSPKRYSSGPSATPSVEKEFRSQLSVCSEPPPPVRQLSGQSSMEPAVPEESLDQETEMVPEQSPPQLPRTSYEEITELQHHTSSLPPKKARPGFLPLALSEQESEPKPVAAVPLYRSNSSRQFYRPKKGVPNERDDSVFYIRSMERGLSGGGGGGAGGGGNGSGGAGDEQMYDSLRVINERRSTLLKADSQSSLGSAERKLSSFSLKMPEITERENSIDVEDPPTVPAPPSPACPPADIELGNKDNDDP
ncbi:hypothetical protein KR018_008569 [Drosophila ironensis]|nr:hypothetical protein KR018_008569 [Drosophila ironensis]